MSNITRTEAKDRRERLKRLLADPHLIDTICGHVANGGTLITLCETWDVRFGDISNWIHADRERERRYIKALNDRGEWGVERVLQELRELGFSDLRKIFDEKGRILDPSMWPDGVAKAVSSIEVDELFDGSGKDKTHIGFTKKVKFWDKSRALEMLGKNLRMFIDRHELSGTVKLEDILASSRDEEQK